MKKIAMMLTVLAGIGLTVIESGFTAQQTQLKYRYLGTSPAGIDNPENWEDVSSEEDPGASCGTIGDLPCTVEFLSNEYSSIDDFLDNHDTVSEINGSGKVEATKVAIP